MDKLTIEEIEDKIIAISNDIVNLYNEQSKYIEELKRRKYAKKNCK